MCKEYFFQKNNYLQYPKLVLRARFIFKAGAYIARYMKQLYYMSKDKLISSTRMARNIAFTDYMSKQKVKPTITLYSKELTSVLNDKYAKKYVACIIS